MSRLIRLLSGLLLLTLVSTAQPAAPPSNRDRHGDPLPRGAVARLGSVRFRVVFGDMPVAMSPDGKRVFVVGQQDFSLGVCDVTTGATRRLRFADLNEENEVQQVVVSPVCDRVLVQTGKLTAYDPQSVKKLWSVDAVNSTTPITFDPTGKHFVRYEADVNKEAEGVAVIHRADNGKKTATLELKGQDVRLALSPDGSRLLSWDTQPPMNAPRPAWEVVFHDVAKNKEVARVPFSKGLPLVAFRPDGKEVAIATDNLVTILDPSDAKKSRTLRAANTVSSLLYSPDGKHLAADCFRRVDLWEVATWKRLPTRPLPENDMGVMAFPGAGRLLVASVWAGELIVADALTGKTTRSPAGHAGPVTALHFDGSQLRTGGGDGKVITWDRSGRQLSQVKVVNELNQLGNGIGILGGAMVPGGGAGGFPFNPLDVGGMRMAFSPSGRWVVSEMGAVYDLKAGEMRFDAMNEASGFPDTIRISRDDVLFVAGLDEEDPNGTGAKLSAMRLGNGEMLWSVKVPAQGAAGRVAVSPDDKVVAMMVVSGDVQSSVHLFDAATGKPLKGVREYEVTGIPGQMLEFSADGRYLVGSTQNGLFFLDPRDGTLSHSMKLEGAVLSVALCPLGRTVAVVLGDQVGARPVLSVYEISSGKERMKLTSGDAVTAMRFSPDGKQLATGLGNGTALIWDLEPERTPMKGDAWKRLSGEDAADAYRATWQLRRDPERAVELVKKHVEPSPPGPRAEEVKRLLVGLDDDDAKVRDESEQTLKSHGRAVESALRQALKETTSTEVKRSVKRLLGALPNELSGLTPALRGVELLEGVGSEGAIEVLTALAKGNASSRLTQEAKAALSRLTKSSKDREKRD